MNNRGREGAFIGENVRWLRRQANLTQSQLAAQIGIHQGALSRIESGENYPSSPVLLALCDALAVPADALLARSGSERRITLRDAGRRPIRVDADGSAIAPPVLETAERLMDAFHAVEDICGAQKSARIPFNMLNGHSLSRITQAVNALRAYMGIQSGVLFDYFELFESFGLRVLVLSWDDPADGFSFYDPPNRNAFLFIHAERSPERQLFRLCYELGHLELYVSDVPRPAGPDDLDAHHAARKFAALFLLPEIAVRSTVLQLGIKERRWTYDLLLRIKHRFGVSAEMFLYRLGELELIAPELIAAFKARIYRHYENTGNQEPDSTRRILTPNGRLWDLVLTAGARPEHAEELAEVERQLREKGVVRS